MELLVLQILVKEMEFQLQGNRLPDGRPDPLQPGEPNFGYTDLDEADQIGLTSFKSSQWNTDLKIAR